MSYDPLIYFEAGFLVLLSWVIAVVLLRRLAHQLDEVKALAIRRKNAWKDCREELRDARLTIARLEQQLEEANSPNTEIDATLYELDQQFSEDVSSLGELTSIHEAFVESVDRLEAGNAADASINELLHKELALLREQNSRSGGVINTLSKSLQRSRERVRELEKNQRKSSGEHGSVNTELEAGYRRLAHENKSLHIRINKAAEKHQFALQQISDKLRMSEEKYRTHVSEANDRQQSMQSIINQLREQLREADGQQMDSARIDELMNRIKEMDDALGRALRERDFLDERYVELEQALSVSQEAAEELERAKVEYRMLEDRYLEMEERINKSIIEERKRNRTGEVEPVAYREKGIDAMTDDIDQL